MCSFFCKLTIYFSESGVVAMVGHSHIALSHEECRGWLCTCCGFKLSTSSVMSAAAEALVQQFGPHPAYDSSILSYPTGLCSTCHRCLYKIRAGTPVKAWGGPQPPSWAQFNIDTIYGVRKCGTTDQQEEVTMYDLCSPISDSGKFSLFLSRRG